MTIWGAIITTLSTVLPAFGPLLGLNITAELVHQLGDQIVVSSSRRSAAWSARF